MNQHQTMVNQLLKDTARSFYLTLRLLPEIIRWPLTLTYLIARATDTLADEFKISQSRRLFF